MLWIQGPENLREAALDYQLHINEYHREMHFEALVDYLSKSKINHNLQGMKLFSKFTGLKSFTEPDTFITGTIIYVSIYIATALIEIIGAHRVSIRLMR